MSVIGPRPQLVRDMTFMTKEQRMRHTAKPGLSGLAQVNGRNAITWEDKLEWDQKYIKKVGFKVFYTLAGPEISVATTKAYSAQLVAMYCLAVQFARVKNTITDVILEAGVSDQMLREYIAKSMTEAKENSNSVDNNYRDLALFSKIRYMTTNYDRWNKGLPSEYF